MIAKEAWDAVNTCTPYHPESFVQGYIASAEPREKQIAELEEEVTRLRNENLDIINKYTRFAETDRRTIAELEQENKVLAQNLEDTEIVNKALEKENERLTDELKSLRESIKDYGAGCYENGLRNGKRKLEAQIADLEKENAELKEKVNILDNCDRLGDVITEAYKDKLTKAKNALKKFVDFANGERTIPIKWITETEQFLSEVENV